MCYKSADEPAYLRDAVFTQIAMGTSYSWFGNEGTYANFAYNYPLKPTGKYGYDFETHRALINTHLKNGKPIINSDLVTEKFTTGGIYDVFFDGQPNVGMKQSLMVV
jgi:hypothetical protein